MTHRVERESGDVPAIASLLSQARARAPARLLALPNLVTVDGVQGVQALDIPWSESQHLEALRAIAEPCSFDDGCTASRVGNAVRIEAPLSTLTSLDSLVQGGMVSALASRLLSAAVVLGRNILVVGPVGPSAAVAVQLAAVGRRPALWADRSSAVPPGYVRADSLDALRQIGADAIAMPQADFADLVRVLPNYSGVVASASASHLPRALVRFEAAVERAHPGVAAPLHVLASLDLVVVVDAGMSPKVSGIAEISWVEEGYRPRMLFATGMQPVPTALVPVAAPSFVQELGRAGDDILVDDLMHAVPQDGGQHGGQRSTPRAAHAMASQSSLPPSEEPAPRSPLHGEMPAPAASQPSLGNAAVGAVANDLLHGPDAQGPSGFPPLPDPDLASATPPGWELDQLPEGDALGPEATAQGMEDAELAASYGLGPPPPPRSLAQAGIGAALDGAAEGESPAGGTFAQALGRVRARETEPDAPANSDDFESGDP